MPENEYAINKNEKEMILELMEISNKLDELISEHQKVYEEYNEESELLDSSYTEKLAKSQNLIKPLEVKHSRLLNRFWDSFLERTEIDYPDDLIIDFDKFVVFADTEECDEHNCGNCASCETTNMLRLKIKKLEEQLSVKKLLDE